MAWFSGDDKLPSAWNDEQPDGPPSSSALGEPSEFKKHQQSPAAFHFNRPPSAAATMPVTLNHPIFGQFNDAYKTHIPTKEDNDLAFALSSVMSGLCNDESARATAFRKVLYQHGPGIVIQQAFLEGTKYHTDGDMQCRQVPSSPATSHTLTRHLQATKMTGARMTRRLSSFWHHPPSLDEVASMKRYSSMAAVLQFGFSRARA